MLQYGDSHFHSGARTRALVLSKRSIPTRPTVPRVLKAPTFLARPRHTSPNMAVSQPALQKNARDSEVIADMTSSCPIRPAGQLRRPGRPVACRLWPSDGLQWSSQRWWLRAWPAASQCSVGTSSSPQRGIRWLPRLRRCLPGLPV